MRRERPTGECPEKTLRSVRLRRYSAWVLAARFARLGLPGAERQAEGAAAARRAVDLEPGAVGLGDPAGEAQPEAGARGAGGSRLRGAVEALEDALLLLGRNAGSAVDDGDADRVGRRGE